MSTFALARLVVAGNRSSIRRLRGITGGVMIGVSLFLLLFAASQAFGERSLRSTWVELVSPNPTFLTDPNTPIPPGHAAAASTSDHYRGHVIRVLKVAVTEQSTIQIPGVSTAPQLGEYVVSPALKELIDDAPAAQLGDRYGTQIGMISDSALEGPDSLVVVKGTTVNEIVQTDSMAGAQLVTEFPSYDYSSNAYRVIAMIGAVAVLVPVLLLISIITDLGAAQRSERFATLRLMGATPEQVSRIAAIETAVPTLIGAVLGSALYFAYIPLAAQINLGSSRFYPSDLVTGPLPIVALILGTVVAATAIAWWRTRRAGIGPLGATRERHEAIPRAQALLPLCLGIAGLLIGGWTHNIEAPELIQLLTFVVSFLMLLVGLLTAGPWLTQRTASFMASRARSASQVIAFNRLAKHPREGFRSVAGLVIAIYTVTVFAVGATAAAGTSELHDGPDYLSPSALVAFTLEDPVRVADAVAHISSSPGVSSVVMASPLDDGRLVLAHSDAVRLGAEQVAGDPEVVAVDARWTMDSPAHAVAAEAPAPHSASSVLFIEPRNSSDSLEEARTAVATSGLILSVNPFTRGDSSALTATALENQFAALAYIGILIATALSAVSLTVSAMASVISRQRVFGLLKLAGMPIGQFRSVVRNEALLPISTIVLTSIALGAFTAWSLVTGLSGRTVSWPDPAFYVVLLLCALLLVGSIALTMRFTNKTLSSTTTRFE